MLAHPILASEDDEDVVCRTIYGLPEALKKLFLIMNSVLNDGKAEHRRQMILEHTSVSRMIELLANIPRSSFHSMTSGQPNAEVENGIEQMVHIWNAELRKPTMNSLTWKYPLINLAESTAEAITESRVRFPLHRRMLRQLSTPHSLHTKTLVLTYLVLVFATCLAVILIPSIGAANSAGVATGVVLAVLLVAVTAVLLAAYHHTQVALDTLYSRVFFDLASRSSAVQATQNAVTAASFDHVGGGGEQVAFSESGWQQRDNFNVLMPSADAFSGERYDGSPTVVHHAAGAGPGGGGGAAAAARRGPGATAAAAAKLSSKKHTKQGFFTIAYDGQVGYIDGQFVSSQVVMIGFDAEYCVTLWNAAAESTTGFLASECLGKPLSDLVDSPSGDIRHDVLTIQKQKGQSIKIRLRAFATAPVTLFTIVAPVVTAAETETIGSVLICANAKDNLKEAKAFLHDYQMLEIRRAAQHLLDQKTLSRDDEEQLEVMSRFTRLATATGLAEYARSMVYEWEWTTSAQLFGRAVGTLISKCVLRVDPSFPQTLSLNPYVAGTIGNAVSEAPSRCDVSASVVQPHHANDAKVSRLAIVITLASNSRPFDSERTLSVLEKNIETTCAYCHFFADDMALELHFPCQTAALLEDLGEASQRSGEEEITCTVNVITLISNSVDRHNVSMVLLKVNFVSLTNVQDSRDLEKKIASHDVDVIIADRSWFATAKTLTGKDSNVILIPLIPSELESEGGAGHNNDGSPQMEQFQDPDRFGFPLQEPPPPQTMSDARSLPPAQPPFSSDAPTSAQQQHQQLPSEAAAALSQYIIRSPIQRNVLDQLMREVGKEVEGIKAARAEQEERNKILTLRQDSPWTQGKLLGRGAFGAVYEAISDLTGGKMAVKMFYFNREGEENIINDLLNEIKIMCSLNHPNIVHYFYCERKDKAVNLFMELCDCSLADHMQSQARRRGTVLKAWSVLRQVVVAVAYLHDRGVVHRDIKPQNILIKGDKIKLTDFGTSRQTAPDEALSDTQGTFRYMAPEVYKGEAHTTSCDIWSIGCLACEFFLFPPKFMEKRFSNLLGEMSGAVDLPQNMSGVLRDFAVQCLQLNPALRPTAHMLLLHPLLSESPEVESMPSVFDAKTRASVGGGLRQGAFSFNSSFSMSSDGEKL